MENKFTFKSYLTDICIIFTVILLTFVTAGMLGSDKMEVASTVYETGGKLMSYTTILQILLCSVVIITLKMLIFSEILLKRTMLLWRIVLMVLFTGGVTAACIIVFGWFPSDDLLAWVMFVISFLASLGISTAIMAYETKKESMKYEILLEEYKQNRSKGEEKKEMDSKEREELERFSKSSKE